jgi:hypothetical protein
LALQSNSRTSGGEYKRSIATTASSLPTYVS